MGLFDTKPGMSAGGFGYGALSAGEVGELVKALQTSYVTDATQMIGGRALIPENLEGQVVNALLASKNDLKLFNRLYNQKVTSPLHEYVRRDAVGDYMGVFAAEGAAGRSSNQTLERIVKAMKYMQTYREVTLQMQVSQSLEEAVASEIEAGTFTLLQGTEYAFFHGNSNIVPTQFDSLETQVKADPNSTILDNRGQTMAAANAEANLNELARQIFEKGGSADVLFCPPVVSKDIQSLVASRMLIRPGDSTMTTVIKHYPTLYGSDMEIAGEGAGPNKFFFPMNAPIPSTDTVNMPATPVLTSAVAGSNAGPGPGFVGVMVGGYYYQAFAISEAGISNGSATVAATVTANGQVTLTVTPGAAWGSGPGAGGTGIILCRSNVGASSGADCREFTRIPGGLTGSSTPVTYVDQNVDLPGTAKLFVLTDSKINRSIQYDSFLPLMKFDLFPTNSLVTPFMMAMFGALDVKIPRRHAMIKNVGHSGVSTWTYA